LPAVPAEKIVTNSASAIKENSTYEFNQLEPFNAQEVIHSAGTAVNLHASQHENFIAHKISDLYIALLY